MPEKKRFFVGHLFSFSAVHISFSALDANKVIKNTFNVEYQFSVIMSRHCTLWLGSNRSLIWMSGIIRLLLALSPHLNCNQQVYSAYLPEDCNMSPKFITKRLSKESFMTFKYFLTVFNGYIALKAIGYRFRQSKMILCYRKQYPKVTQRYHFATLERASDFF